MFDSKKLIKEKRCRSRFALFIKHNKSLGDKRSQHSREPSRMPVKALKRAKKFYEKLYIKNSTQNFLPA